MYLKEINFQEVMGIKIKHREELKYNRFEFIDLCINTNRRNSDIVYRDLVSLANNELEKSSQNTNVSVIGGSFLFGSVGLPAMAMKADQLYNNKPSIGYVFDTIALTDYGLLSSIVASTLIGSVFAAGGIILAGIKNDSRKRKKIEQIDSTLDNLIKQSQYDEVFDAKSYDSVK